MKTKIIAIVLSVLMLVGLITGCAQTDTGSTTGTTQKSAEATTEGKASEPYVPTFPIVEEKVTFTAVTNRENMGDRVFSQAYEEATNVHIDWIYYSDPETQVGITLASGELPDMFFRIGVDKLKAKQYGDAGLFVNYADYLHLMPYMTELMDEYPQSWPCVKNEDGSIYALAQVGISLTGNSGTVYYRTDMMDELGWSVPKTDDEFYEYILALQKANSDNPDFIAFQPYSRDHLSHLDYFFFPSFGPEVDIEFGVETGSVVFSPITDQYRHYVEFMNKIYKSGAYDKNIYTEDGTASKARILGHNTGITTYGTMFSLSDFKSGNYDMDLFAPLTSEYQSEQRYKARNVPAYAYMHIASSCKDVETLVKWVNSLYAQRDQQIAEGVYAISGWFGVEGVNWRYVDDELSNYEVIVPPGYKSAAEYISNKLGYSTHMGAGIWYGLNIGDPGQLCKGTGTKNNLIPYNVTGFPEAYLSYSTDEVEDIVDYYTDIKDYVSTMTAKFIAGEENIDVGWDRYVSEIKKMNIDKVIAIKQAAYERYEALMQ